MDNGPIDTDKKKRNKTKQLTPSTERKASGCNWETYKSLFTKAKTEESTEEKSISQKKPPKVKKVYTTPLYTVNRFILYCFEYTVIFTKLIKL